MAEFVYKNGIAYLKWEYDTIPISLFKYTTVEALRHILSSNQFKFRNPTEFDDRFDCNLNIKTTKDINKIRTALSKSPLYKNNFIRREAKALDIFNNIDYYDKMNKEFTNEVVKNYGVHCFTSDSNNWEMWKQYANNHLGVCIGFSLIDEDTDFFGTPHTVKYVEQYPTLDSLDFLDLEKNTLINLMTIKHMNYSYEKEIRVWKNPNLGFYRFNKNSIQNIFLGYKLKNNIDVINEIINLTINNGYEKVKLWQANLIPDTHSVIYQLINYK